MTFGGMRITFQMDSLKTFLVLTPFFRQNLPILASFMYRVKKANELRIMIIIIVIIINIFFNLQVANSPTRLWFEANLSRESSECTEHSQDQMNQINSGNNDTQLQITLLKCVAIATRLPKNGANHFRFLNPALVIDLITIIIKIISIIVIIIIIIKIIALNINFNSL